jgi:hypothetical protein
MSLTLLLALQVAIAAPVPPDFDLGKYRPSANCESQGPYEVVVCGRRHADRNRVLPIEGDFETGPLRAEMGVGRNMKGSVDVDSVRFPNGTESKRLMVRLRVPF